MNNEYESGRYGTNIKYFEDEPNYTSYYNNDSSVKATPNVAYIEESEQVIYDWSYAPDDWDPDDIGLSKIDNPTVYNILNDAGIEHESPDEYTIGELQAITLEDITRPAGSENLSWDDEEYGVNNSIFWCYDFFYDGASNYWQQPEIDKVWTFDEFKYFTGITEIPPYFFSNCYGMTSITIPRTVTKIGQNAFHDCWNLDSITIEYSPQTLYILDTDYDFSYNTEYGDYDWETAFPYVGKWFDSNWNNEEYEDEFYRDTHPELGYTSSIDRLEKLIPYGKTSPILNTNNRPIIRAYGFDQNGIPITAENLETYMQINSNNGDGGNMEMRGL